MQGINDDILISAAAGDLASFEAVYKASASFVYNVALRIVNNKEDAEEVTQEVFLIIHHKLKSFRFESSFKTWVYRITANCALNFAKKMSKPLNKTVEYDEQITPQAVAGAVEQHMDQEDQRKVIDDLLNALNPDQRACVVLRNIEGLSYEEIAGALKININTVRSRLKRARENLLALKKKVGYGQV